MLQIKRQTDTRQRPENGGSGKGVGDGSSKRKRWGCKGRAKACLFQLCRPRGVKTSSRRRWEVTGGWAPAIQTFPLQAPQVGTFKASRKNRDCSLPQTPFFLGKVKGGQTPPDPLYIHICGYRGPTIISTSDAMQSAQVTPTPTCS